MTIGAFVMATNTDQQCLAGEGGTMPTNPVLGGVIGYCYHYCHGVMVIYKSPTCGRYCQYVVLH